MPNATFPYNASFEQAYKRNPAIRLYGNRYSSDQNSLELLCEFLLLTSSVKKIEDHEITTAFPSQIDLQNWDNSKLFYHPKSRLNLKLFAFLGASRLDTRHLTHREQYSYLLKELLGNLRYSDGDKTQVLKTLESLLLGFQGAGAGRTWCAQSFLPLCPGLICAESIWNESKAKKQSPQSWSQILDDVPTYFAQNKHLFFARGGELLYLQLCLALKQDESSIKAWALAAGLELSATELNPAILLDRLEKGIAAFFGSCPKLIDDLADFIDTKLDTYTAQKTDMLAHEPRYVEAGWCNSATWQEGYLLAVDLSRILSAGLDIIDCIYYLDTLFMLHTLRNLSMQSVRAIGFEQWPGYYMAVNNPEEERGTLKRISHQSLKKIEKSIYQAIRLQLQESDNLEAAKILKEADSRSGHKFFLRLAKQAGLVIPRRGGATRFVLSPQILRVLVITVVPPGGRVTYDTFKSLIKAKWGMVFDEAGFGDCCQWLGVKKIYLSSDTDAWLLEMLAESGLLMHLSDSCALVLHPQQSSEGAIS